MQAAAPARHERPRALVLLSQIYVDGGIQRFNRTFLSACDRLGVACEVLSLADTEESRSNWAAPDGASVRTFNRSKMRFAFAVFAATLRGRHDFIVVGHIKNARIAILTNDPPEMPPFALTLQCLRKPFLCQFEFLESCRIQIMRRVHLHLDLKQHLNPPPPGIATVLRAESRRKNATLLSSKLIPRPAAVSVHAVSRSTRNRRG